MTRSEYIHWRSMGAVALILHHYYEQFYNKKIHISVFNHYLDRLQQQILAESPMLAAAFGHNNPYDRNIKFQNKIAKILEGYDEIFNLSFLYSSDNQETRELIKIF